MAESCRAEAFTEGIQTVVEHGSTIRVYCLAKTITDCVKFCHKVGLDVALEALKNAGQRRMLYLCRDQVTHFARINQASKVSHAAVR